MSLRRFHSVLRIDLLHNARRPLFWIWLLVLGLLAWGLSNGNVTIESGDSSVGGAKSHLTSQFANAQLLALFVPILYGFFMAVGAGMALIQDEEHGVGPILHATPLRPGEYVWAKYLAGLASFVVMLVLHLLFMAFFNHVVTDAEAAELVGPFRAANYLVPALVLAVPAIVALSGLAFALGTWTRRPILVFFFPVALFLVDVFFLWNEPPEWMSPRVDHALRLLDPSGFRWLNETWLRVDRGVAFYNAEPIPFDAAFLASRLGYVLLGLLAVFLAERHFARHLRGSASLPRSRAAVPAEPAPARPVAHATLAGLAMGARPRGFLADVSTVASIEFGSLIRSPGLYLFVPLILVQTFGNVFYARGVFETRRLLTSGTLATDSLGMLTTLIALLLLFYTVESLRREEGTRLGPIHAATPLRTAAILTGKALANSLVAVATLLCAFLACALVLLVQGKVALEIGPFVMVWVILLVPTFLLWSSFVSFLYCLTRNRYTTYALGIGVLILTAWRIAVGELTWVTNWPLWGALRWSDIGTFELVRDELVLNRLLALAGTLLFTVLTVRLYPRRQEDATARLLRRRPARLARAALRLTPAWLPAGALALALLGRVDEGFQGEAAEKAGKDYWRKNVQTWKDAPTPDLAGVEFTLDLEPAERTFELQGEYVLVNRTEAPLRVLALTPGLGWRRPQDEAPPSSASASAAAGESESEGPLWTLDGAPFTPEDSAGLALFRLARPLAPEESVRIGFHYAAEMPAGATKNGGGASEFVLPSSVVLTSFGPSFVPWVGFMEGLGVDEENQSDAREYEEDFHLGLTPSGFGPASAPYPVRSTLRGPADFVLNGVGTLVSDEVADGRRTSVWQSDHPVRFFNVVAGRWTVAEGQGTAIYHHPEHAYNVPAMLAALDAARARYSEWFHPYPWERLKLSEFAGLASYAQGFGTNITFSESIGFLTLAEDTPADAPFLVTAHEAAHQWWGNLLVPGKGPGGDLLSEGMAHFSTLLLMESERGLEARIAFAERIEEQYCEQRVADSERALVRVDGTRDGDGTVTYDKGGWVFWMLLNAMGRERNLAGLRAFLGESMTSRDHPVLQDFLASMRPFAPDAGAFDAFEQQWFREVVLPEYRLSEVARRSEGDAWIVTLRLENAGTGRMPVEVAATRGVRFPARERAGAAVVAATEEEPYREARAAAVLGPGESAELVLECAFEPEELRTDPDALVLMLQRERARHRF